MVNLEGFHGTSAAAGKSILASQFKISCKEDEWLGFGVYFFVQGISDPQINAADWAKAQAYDLTSRSYKYEEYCVLKCSITLDEGRMIDLTDMDGLVRFNMLKKIYFDKIFKDFELSTPPKEHNCKLFNAMISQIKGQSVKHNLYIKNTRERRMKLQLNVPNTTVLCVHEVGCCGATQIAEKGAVK